MAAEPDAVASVVAIRVAARSDRCPRSPFVANAACARRKNSFASFDACDRSSPQASSAVLLTSASAGLGSKSMTDDITARGGSSTERSRKHEHAVDLAEPRQKSRFRKDGDAHASGAKEADVERIVAEGREPVVSGEQRQASGLFVCAERDRSRRQKDR